jgi:hypothetical protein
MNTSNGETKSVQPIIMTLETPIAHVKDLGHLRLYLVHSLKSLYASMVYL